MSIADEQELRPLLESLGDGMLSYMGEYDAVLYSKAHVEECLTILRQFGETLDGISDHANAMESVKRTIFRLNELNDRGGGALIETDQGEDICMYIIKYCMMTGHLEHFEDVTEEWRDW